MARGGKGCDNRRGLHKLVFFVNNYSTACTPVLYSTQYVFLSWLSFFGRFIFCLFFFPASPSFPFLLLSFFSSFCLLYFTSFFQISHPMFCRACLCYYCSYIDGRLVVLIPIFALFLSWHYEYVYDDDKTVDVIYVRPGVAVVSSLGSLAGLQQSNIIINVCVCVHRHFWPWFLFCLIDIQSIQILHWTVCC